MNKYKYKEQEIKRKDKKWMVTSDHSYAYVQMCNRVGKRSSYHGNTTHQAADHNHWAASKTVDQHAANRSCGKRKCVRERKREGGERKGHCECG